MKLKKNLFLYLGLIFTAAAICFLLMYFRPWTWRFGNDPVVEVEEKPGYQSPLDWKALKEKNSDIIAWLEIPVTQEAIDTGAILRSDDSILGTGKAFISYPVLQNPDNDEFYLDHDENGVTYYEGSLFTQATYNKTDFSDPCVAIYGHHMRNSDRLFARLEKQYSSPVGFTSCQTIKIYLPDQEKTYKVWAAVPFDDRHILDNYDFTNRKHFTGFIDEVRSVRQIGMHFDESITVTPEDHILILSTCLSADPDNCRFLVIAVEQPQ